MSYGQLSWIADLLMDDVEERKHVIHVVSETSVYGSTSGPWGGIGGSAMSEFTMTLITLVDGYVVYADERRMGRVKPECVELVTDRFPYVKAEWIYT